MIAYVVVLLRAQRLKTLLVHAAQQIRARDRQVALYRSELEVSAG